MLKTSGHVKKYYKPCCIIFEDFKERNGVDATLAEFIKSIETHAVDVKEEDARLSFKGDMLEILAEIFFKATATSPIHGLRNYSPIPLEEDYGVDGQGENAAGAKCAVQVKYRHDPFNSVLYAELARTYTSAILQLKMPMVEDNCLWVFTTANGVTSSCDHVFGNKLRIINRNIIHQEISNNISFWEFALNEIAETLGVPA